MEAEVSVMLSQCTPPLAYIELHVSALSVQIPLQCVQASLMMLYYTSTIAILRALDRAGARSCSGT